MYFDTHAHYDDEQFDSDRDGLLQEIHRSGVGWIVNPGSSLASSEKALSIAQHHDFVYAAAGVHPENADGMTEEDLERLRGMSRHPKTVAIGEIGLDYHYEFTPRAVQQRVFRRQMELAREVKLPVIVHEREAAEDTLRILRDFPDVPGVLHCFSGSWETAKLLLDQGWMLSFTGVITFKNARRAPEVIQKMPADRLMIETDSPYLAPVPMRGRRNCSLYLPYICQTVADLRGITLEEAAALTTENGIRFFRLKAGRSPEK